MPKGTTAAAGTEVRAKANERTVLGIIDALRNRVSFQLVE
jgi:hypothetical protein